MTRCSGPRAGRALALGDPGQILVATRDAVYPVCTPDGHSPPIMRAPPGTELTRVVGGHGQVVAAARDGSLLIRSGVGPGGAPAADALPGTPGPSAILHIHAGRLDAIALGPDGRWGVAGGLDGRLVFFILPDMRPATAEDVAGAIARWGFDTEDPPVDGLLDAP